VVSLFVRVLAKSVGGLRPACDALLWRFVQVFGLVDWPGVLATLGRIRFSERGCVAVILCVGCGIVGLVQKVVFSA
jgi:hypothetical protein